MTIKIGYLIWTIVILIVIILIFSVVCFKAAGRADKWEEKILNGKVSSKK